MQCLAPWLDGLIDPAQLKAHVVALGDSLTNGLAPALTAVATDVNGLAVSSQEMTGVPDRTQHGRGSAAVAVQDAPSIIHIHAQRLSAGGGAKGADGCHHHCWRRRLPHRLPAAGDHATLLPKSALKSCSICCHLTIVVASTHDPDTFLSITSGSGLLRRGWRPANDAARRDNSNGHGAGGVPDGAAADG